MSDQDEREREYRMHMGSYPAMWISEPAKHGTADADWVDASERDGGAKEIAALRAALAEQLEKHNAECRPFWRLKALLKQILTEDED